MTDLTPQKSRAWDTAIARGYLTDSQVAACFNEAGDDESTLWEIRTAIRRQAARADREGNSERHHALLLALSQIDDARDA